jgi:hypothetical protein
MGFIMDFNSLGFGDFNMNNYHSYRKDIIGHIY